MHFGCLFPPRPHLRKSMGFFDNQVGFLCRNLPLKIPQHPNGLYAGSQLGTENRPGLHASVCHRERLPGSTVAFID